MSEQATPILHPSLPLQALLLITCVLIGAWLRFDFFPDTYYSDEEIPIAVVHYMESHDSLDTNWRKGLWRNPAHGWAFGYDQYNFSSYNSTLFYLHQLFDVRERNWNPALFNRISSVVFQLLALVLIFVGLRLLVGPLGASVASLFFAVNPLLVVDAHYGRPESFLLLIVAIAVLCQLRAHQQHKLPGFWVAAFFWGIACACKFSLLPMAGLAALHLLLVQRRPASLGLWLLSFTAGAFVLAPYLFLNADKVWNGVQFLFQQYFNADSASSVSFQRSDALLPKYLLAYFGLGFWLATLYALFARNPFQLCLARWLLPITLFYIAIFSLLSFFNESNLSHLAILWCLLLAVATENLMHWSQRSGIHQSLALGIFLLLTLATPALYSFRIQQQVYNPDARQLIEKQAADLEARLLADHPGARIVDPLKQAFNPGEPVTYPLLVKIPWNERNEHYAFHRQLLAQHYTLEASLPLPLGDLPHSQLQSIHFPAAYRYYLFTP